MAEQGKHTLFASFARWTEHQVGRSSTFVLAIAVVVLWAVSGPVFAWSDTWQLVINTGTTIITFLMVFVIQNTQSRDTRAIQLKLDELIRVSQEARNSLISVEDKPDAEVDKVKETLADVATVATLATDRLAAEKASVRARPEKNELSDVAEDSHDK